MAPESVLVIGVQACNDLWRSRLGIVCLYESIGYKCADIHGSMAELLAAFQLEVTG